MKKFSAFLLVLLLLAGGSWYTYNYFYGGKDYYTKISATGESTEGHWSNGESYTEYTYQQQAYDKNGNESTQEMREIREKPLRIGAYLKLKVNDRKGIISWEEVNEKEIPKKAQQQLDKQAS